MHNRKGVGLLILLICLIAAAAWACSPPWGGIHRPGEGATLSGTTPIAVEVKSETQVVGVDIYLDGALLATLSSAPYSYDWDTTKEANGKHKLHAKVRALRRADGASAAIAVTVSN